MKYLIIWVIVNWVNDPCPGFETANDYGISSGSISCAVLHGHYENGDTLKRVFNSKDSAEMFFNNGLKLKPAIALDSYPEMISIKEIKP